MDDYELMEREYEALAAEREYEVLAAEYKISREAVLRQLSFAAEQASSVPKFTSVEDADQWMRENRAF